MDKIDPTKPFAGYLDLGFGDHRYEIRLVVPSKIGPIGYIVGRVALVTAARNACEALNVVTGIQNAGQLHSSGLRPLST